MTALGGDHVFFRRLRLLCFISALLKYQLEVSARPVGIPSCLSCFVFVYNVPTRSSYYTREDGGVTM